MENELGDDGSKELFATISKKSGLSIELLKDGNILARFIHHYNKICSPLEKDETYKIAYNEDNISELRQRFSGLTNNKNFLKLFDREMRNLQDLSFTAHSIHYGHDNFKLLIKFVEQVILNQPNEFAQFLNNKVEKNDLLNLIVQAQNGINKNKIENYFEELLLTDIPHVSVNPPSFLLIAILPI